MMIDPILLGRAPGRAPLLTVWAARSFFGWWSVQHNITPSAINRQDRAALGLWFVEVYAGPLHFWLSGRARRRG